MIDQTLARLLLNPEIMQAYVGVLPGDPNSALVGQTLSDCEKARIVVIECGKGTRAGTVLELAQRPQLADCWLVVHDAVRPCVDPADVSAVLEQVKQAKIPALLAEPLAHTLKQVDGTEVARTLPREGLWLAQTPQVAPAGMLVEALRANSDVTDEAQALELAGQRMQVVQASHPNPKVTTLADFEMAARILAVKCDHGHA